MGHDPYRSRDQNNQQRPSRYGRDFDEQARSQSYADREGLRRGTHYGQRSPSEGYPRQMGNRSDSRNLPAYNRMDDVHQGRSNRATGHDDYSNLGRGHGFGPKMSTHGMDVFQGGRARENVEHDPRRDFSRNANSRQRGELEQDEYPRGSSAQQGYGSRSRSYESRRRRFFDSGDDFD